MRVYVKRKDRQTMIPGIIVTFVFLFVSIFIFSRFFVSGKSFIDTLESVGTSLVFAILFFGFSLYFIFYLIKRPKAFKFTLVKKKSQTYNGKKITYMKFSTTQKDDQNEEDTYSYECYTNGDNDLVVGNDYLLFIKEFNWQPKYVKALNDSYKYKEKMPKKSLSIVFWAVGFIFGGMLLFCILGLITHPEYAFIYIAFGILNLLVLITIYKMNYAIKNDKNLLYVDNDDQ